MTYVPAVLKLAKPLAMAAVFGGHCRTRLPASGTSAVSFGIPSGQRFVRESKLLCNSRVPGEVPPGESGGPPRGVEGPGKRCMRSGKRCVRFGFGGPRVSDRFRSGLVGPGNVQAFAGGGEVGVGGKALALSGHGDEFETNSIVIGSWPSRCLRRVAQKQRQVERKASATEVP